MNYSKKKLDAIRKSENYYNALFKDINNEKERLTKENLASVGAESLIDDENIKKSILKYTPISYADIIYNNQNFKDYVKYAFVAKRCQKAINRIIILFVILLLLVAGTVFFLTKNIIISLIVGVIILIAFVIIFGKKLKGESYSNFYKRTMYPIIYNVLDNFKYMDASKNKYSLPVKHLVNKKYTSQQVSNKLLFSNDFCNCEIYDLKLIQKNSKTVNGKTTTTTSEVFDGFSVSLVYNQSINILKGAIIEIREDENILSAIMEDTVNSMFESKFNYNFNSEELNKSLDCTISGTNNFNDIDELMMEVNKIITPLFEEYLLYLKKRYNSFNMTITDSLINFNVSLDKTVYQKFKNGNLFSFDSKYNEATKKVSMPTPDLNSAKDYCYYSIFPAMEKLFLMKYFNEIFRSSLDPNNPFNGNTQTIKSYQDSMYEISDTLFKDFKKIYKEEIEGLYKESLVLYKNE